VEIELVLSVRRRGGTHRGRVRVRERQTHVSFVQKRRHDVEVAHHPENLRAGQKRTGGGGGGGGGGFVARKKNRRVSVSSSVVVARRVRHEQRTQRSVFSRFGLVHVRFGAVFTALRASVHARVELRGDPQRIL
jgi:hypothetical protein